MASPRAIFDHAAAHLLSEVEDAERRGKVREHELRRLARRAAAAPAVALAHVALLPRAAAAVVAAEAPTHDGEQPHLVGGEGEQLASGFG